MNSKLLLGSALFVWLLSSVAAVPQFVARDEHCTSTVTVYASTDAPDPSSPTPSLTPAEGGESSPAGKVVTTTVFSTIYASAGSVETSTVISTQTVTQILTQTVTQVATQTVTQTLAQADNAQTVVNTAAAINTAVPPQATSLPYYSNSTSTTTSSRAAVATGYPNASVSSNFQNGLYFTNWGIYGADFQPMQLPVTEITRLYYAFADIGSDGTVKTSDSYADTEKHYPQDSWNDVNISTNAYGCVKQLYMLKQANRNMKILLSIGGWTYSSKFSAVAADATMRQTFVTSAIKLMTDYGFDGIDIDWEFGAYYQTGADVTAADTANTVLLLQDLRAALDAWAATYSPGYHFLLTVAAPAGPQWYAKWDMAGMDPFVDAWNLMAYDYAGAWGSTSGHASNVYPLPANEAATPFNTDQAVTAYIAAGIAPGKISMGMPLYGRSFDGTPALGSAYTSVGTGDSLGTGQWRFKDLPRAGATEEFDAVAVATYSYDSSTQELISYDNVQSITEKMQYMRSKGLGGAMFWEASSDKNGSDESLVVAMAGLLGSLDTSQNLLNFPTSQYSNIRSGTP